MNNRIFLLLVFVMGSVLHAIAQDDLYFVPSKKKTPTKSVVSTYKDGEYDDWAEGRSGVMDVDAYNRRGSNSVTSEYSYEEPAEDAESYTERIIRFHSPGITIVSSPYYTDYIDIYTDPWYTYYRPYRWYSYDWYDYWWWNRPYHWYSSCYAPWWGWHGHHHHAYYPSYHHGWYPHHSGHHHHYYPRRDYDRRPTAVNRGYRPSTERGTRPSANREQRPSANRPSSVKRGTTSTERPSRQPSQKRETTSPNRGSRTPSSPSVSPSRNSRPSQRSTMSGGGGSRPQRSMGGATGGRRR